VSNAADVRGLEAFDEVKRAIAVTAHADDMETFITRCDVPTSAQAPYVVAYPDPP
jgi:hypothetical protein